MRILIVDHNIELWDEYKSLLSDYNECDFAENSFEAIEKFADAIKTFVWYDAVIIEQGLPDIDGVKTLRLFKKLEDFKATAAANLAKIIMTSATPDEEFVKNCIKHRCDGFLVKPIDKASLNKALNKFDIKIYS